MSEMRLLVTGAGGLLGRAVCGEAAARGLAPAALTRAELDISAAAAVGESLDDLRPTFVLNCAAYTDVDGAEAQVAAAIAANVAGPAVLARETAARGVGLLQVSTDHVFGGEAREPYGELDPPAPLSVYGRSKAQGEEWVRALQPRHYVVRTAGLFGEGGRNFVAAIARRAAAGQPLRVVADQVCQRTYAPHLAAALLELVLGGAEFGTYHITNPGAGSWFEFASNICAAANWPVAITPVTSAEWGAAAPRPAYSVLSDAHWRQSGHGPLPPVQTAVAEYLARLAVEA